MLVELLIVLVLASPVAGFWYEFARRRHAEQRADALAAALEQATEAIAREQSRRLARARRERDAHRAWLRTLPDITRYDGWEQAAGVLMRWSDDVDETGDTAD